MGFLKKYSGLTAGLTACFCCLPLLLIAIFKDGNLHAYKSATRFLISSVLFLSGIAGFHIFSEIWSRVHFHKKQLDFQKEEIFYSFMVPFFVWLAIYGVFLFSLLGNPAIGITPPFIYSVLSLSFLIAASFFLGKLSFKAMGLSLFAFLFGVGLWVRFNSIKNYAFNGQSDMLSLIKSALATFLAGNNPYQKHLITMPDKEYYLELTYLPLKWLSYLPFYLMDSDFRYLNLLCSCFLFILFFAAGIKFLNKEDRWGFFAVLVAASGYWLNDYFGFRMDHEMFFFAAILGCVGLCLHYHQHFLLAICTAVMIASNQLSLIVLPFFWVSLVYSIGWRRAVIYSGMALSIAALTILPFFLWNPENFTYGVWGRWQVILGNTYTWSREVIMNFNFTVLFFKTGMQSVLVYVQAFLMVLYFALFLLTRGYEKSASTFCWALTSLATFLFFNIIVWTYLYLALVPLIALILLTVGSNRERFSLKVKTDLNKFGLTSCGLATVAIAIAFFRFEPKATAGRPDFLSGEFDLGYLGPKVFVHVNPLENVRECLPGADFKYRVTIDNQSGENIDVGGNFPASLKIVFDTHKGTQHDFYFPLQDLNYSPSEDVQNFELVSKCPDVSGKYYLKGFLAQLDIKSGHNLSEGYGREGFDVVVRKM